MTRTLWRRYWLAVLYALAAVVVAAQRLTLHKHNVFLIFRSSFYNLLEGANLYAAHPSQHADFYRYSPMFALAFGPIALLPVSLGFVLWCLINFFALYVAVHRVLPWKQAQLVLILVLGDLIRSMQSCQSNALITALMIAAFLAYERDQKWRGAWAVTAGAAIKLFPAVAGLFALLRPGRVKALTALAVASVLIVLVPMVVVGPHVLLQEYKWWFANEQGEVYKTMYSVMDLVDAWTGTYWRRWPIQCAGLAGLLIPILIRRDAWGDAAFRRLILCSLLCFSVLFNHGAETPSYIIALTGIGIWYAAGPRETMHGVLMILTLLFVTVAASDLVPGLWRDRLLDPAKIKVVPVLAAWLVMQVELLRFARASGRAKVDQSQIAIGEALA